MESIRVETTADDLAAFSVSATLSSPAARAQQLSFSWGLSLGSAPLLGWLVWALSANMRAGLLVAALIVALMFVAGPSWWERETRRKALLFAQQGYLGSGPIYGDA
jgi:hypothetical protein